MIALPACVTACAVPYTPDKTHLFPSQLSLKLPDVYSSFHIRRTSFCFIVRNQPSTSATTGPQPVHPPPAYTNQHAHESHSPPPLSPRLRLQLITPARYEQAPPLLLLRHTLLKPAGLGSSGPSRLHSDFYPHMVPVGSCYPPPAAQSILPLSSNTWSALVPSSCLSALHSTLSTKARLSNLAARTGCSSRGTALSYL